MEQVMMWKASDGSVHHTQKEAETRELFIRFHEWYEKISSHFGCEDGALYDVVRSDEVCNFLIDHRCAIAEWLNDIGLILDSPSS